MQCAKPDGIYFDLDENEYHALPRLSSSGIQKMLVSPATFWADSWMNPDKEEEDEEDEPIFRRVGRAYHCARFEPDELDKRFVRELTKADMPEGALTNDAEIKAALKECGEPQTKAGENVLDRARRLVSAYPAAQPPVIWHIEQAAWEEEVKGREIIPPKYWRDIERDVARIHKNPEIAELVTGGAAEVSILWTDPKTGVQMKARLDYLKPKSYTDFKTFDNSRGVHLEQAITNAFRFNRYYVQGSLYWEAAELIRQKAVTIQGKATGAQKSLVNEITQNPVPMAAWYVFQEKKGIPNLLAREFMVFNLHPATAFAAPDEEAEAEARNKFGSHTLVYRKARAEIEWAQKTLLTMLEIYGPDQPWFPINALGRIDDESFNLNWLESDW